ncbi:polysaccharide lyase family 8 super-sandwich domain-containing protein [Phytoactinopolyspora halotolerans]|uniref:Silent information regulator protein Sir2 n=1 Tax=Phytoactinopolyspora halotolerans TaxID=1981512 RepID=A0A6L9S6J5_9ACTN|nr:polysaccharide lyase family 8 super-sandwich domain-containing protein [Phytoactinopolyspora halotolerans]NEE00381.1 silent information regulator protein Sir2 [Phytoactinopolyspora halotolerans]
MPQISRRQALSLIPAASLLVGAGRWEAVARPGAAAADAATDHSRLLRNTIEIFAGDAGSNVRPEVAGKLAAVARTARSRLSAMDDAGDGELFAGQPLGASDVALRNSYQYLYEIALATATEGADSELAGDVDVQRRVADGLVWLHENYYGDQSQGYYGNWYNWEIGISTHVSKTLALLADVVRDYRPDLIPTYVASMDAYLREGENGDVDLDSRFHTGANLADITANRVIQGALLGDDARIGKAISDQSTVFATIDPYNLRHGVTDGYYQDGSFIQHHSVAYTGSYGKALLTRVVQSVKMLDGTSYASGGDLVDVVRGWVVNGFAPLIFEGWMMEIVKGRAVSRTTTGYTDVGIIVEAIVDLADYLDGDDARALQGYVKFIRSTSRATLNPDGFVSPVTIAKYADVLADDSIPAADVNPPERSVAFNAMDKTVHLRPGFAFALARSSDRISKYEYMNGENLMPWFQADGAHYLYLSGQDQTKAFGVDFYTVVSPYRLPGVTAPVEERLTVPELYGGFWYENPEHPLGFTSSSESQNTYVYFPRGTNRHSGGAVLGAYGATGMVQSDDVPYVDKQAGVLPEDFVAYQNARSTKSWFMLDDEVVVLAAGIDGQGGRDAVTTLDSRIADVSDELSVVGASRDGREWSGTGTADVAWLRYANSTEGVAVGYVMLDAARVNVDLEQVTRSRRVVRASNPDTQVTKNVFGVSVFHPAGDGPATLAYALVPDADEAQLRAYPDGGLSVLANNPRVQAIKHTGLGLIAANVFGDGWQAAGHVAVHGPASVLVRQDGDETTVAVSDPTMNRADISVVVRGRPMTLVSADDGVELRPAHGGIRLNVRTHQAYGRTFTARLRAR